MIIHQFEDKCLAHYSYAILSDNKVALIDPERNPAPYYEFARKNRADIVAVFETHPHADFVSSHAEIHRKTGAEIYVSSLLAADYPHETFDEGDVLEMGDVRFEALNTPGHSPDSICIVAYDGDRAEAVFTGDTLFIGDCGRPDLRETAGAVTAKREELARKMYHSLRDKLMKLPDATKVYPTHGAGSLCGKGLSEQNVSTIGAEKASNWSLQDYTEDEFVKELLANQPFVPKYFTNSVEINKAGAPDFEISLVAVKVIDGAPEAMNDPGLIIDTRHEKQFKEGSLPNCVNLMVGGKFETWLGSIVSPKEPFSMIVTSRAEARDLIRRVAKIGYEAQAQRIYVASEVPKELTISKLDVDEFRSNTDDYTIVDIRNRSEVENGKIFDKAVAIPLPELRERVGEIPTDKPIVVHCAAGYRSAAGSSIIKNHLAEQTEVYDLGEAIKQF